MMSATERMQKLLAASAPTLARIDAVLDGTDTAPAFAEHDTRLITYTDGAKRLNVSRPTIYKLVQMGKLKTREIDGVRRIVLQSIFDYVNGVTDERSRVRARAAM